MDYAKYLKECRLKAGMTHAELAKKAKVSVRSIYHWESGSRHMTLEYADKVFKALGIQLVIGAK